MPVIENMLYDSSAAPIVLESVATPAQKSSAEYIGSGNGGHLRPYTFGSVTAATQTEQDTQIAELQNEIASTTPAEFQAEFGKIPAERLTSVAVAAIKADLATRTNDEADPITAAVDLTAGTLTLGGGGQADNAIMLGAEVPTTTDALEFHPAKAVSSLADVPTGNELVRLPNGEFGVPNAAGTAFDQIGAPPIEVGNRNPAWTPTADDEIPAITIRPTEDWQPNDFVIVGTETAFLLNAKPLPAGSKIEYVGTAATATPPLSELVVVSPQDQALENVGVVQVNASGFDLSTETIVYDRTSALIARTNHIPEVDVTIERPAILASMPADLTNFEYEEVLSPGWANLGNQAFSASDQLHAFKIEAHWSATGTFVSGQLSIVRTAPDGSTVAFERSMGSVTEDLAIRLITNPTTVVYTTSGITINAGSFSRSSVFADISNDYTTRALGGGDNSTVGFVYSAVGLVNNSPPINYTFTWAGDGLTTNPYAVTQPTKENGPAEILIDQAWEVDSITLSVGTEPQPIIVTQSGVVIPEVPIAGLTYDLVLRQGVDNSLQVVGEFDPVGATAATVDANELPTTFSDATVTFTFDVAGVVNPQSLTLRVENTQVAGEFLQRHTQATITLPGQTPVTIWSAFGSSPSTNSIELDIPIPDGVDINGQVILRITDRDEQNYNITAASLLIEQDAVVNPDATLITRANQGFVVTRSGEWEGLSLEQGSLLIANKFPISNPPIATDFYTPDITVNLPPRGTPQQILNAVDSALKLWSPSDLSVAIDEKLKANPEVVYPTDAAGINVKAENIVYLDHTLNIPGDFPAAASGLWIGVSVIQANSTDDQATKDAALKKSSTWSAFDTGAGFVWIMTEGETAAAGIDAGEPWDTDTDYVGDDNVQFSLSVPATGGPYVTADGERLTNGKIYNLIYEADRTAADSVAAIANNAATVAEIALMNLIGEVSVPESKANTVYLGTTFDVEAALADYENEQALQFHALSDTDVSTTGNLRTIIDGTITNVTSPHTIPKGTQGWLSKGSSNFYNIVYSKNIVSPLAHISQRGEGIALVAGTFQPIGGGLEITSGSTGVVNYPRLRVNDGVAKTLKVRGWYQASATGEPTGATLTYENLAVGEVWGPQDNTGYNLQANYVYNAEIVDTVTGGQWIVRYVISANDNDATLSYTYRAGRSGAVIQLTSRTLTVTTPSGTVTRTIFDERSIDMVVAPQAGRQWVETPTAQSGLDSVVISPSGTLVAQADGTGDATLTLTDEPISDLPLEILTGSITIPANNNAYQDLGVTPGRGGELELWINIPGVFHGKRMVDIQIRDGVSWHVAFNHDATHSAPSTTGASTNSGTAGGGSDQTVRIDSNQIQFRWDQANRPETQVYWRYERTTLT